MERYAGFTIREIFASVESRWRALQPALMSLFKQVVDPRNLILLKDLVHVWGPVVKAALTKIDDTGKYWGWIVKQQKQDRHFKVFSLRVVLGALAKDSLKKMGAKAFAEKYVLGEDWQKTSALLKDYDRLKSKVPIDERDISKKSYGEVAQMLSPFRGGAGVDPGERDIEGVRHLFNSYNISVTLISTYEAMKEMGRNTGWCVTSKDQFEDYSPPFYYVEETRAGELIGLLHLPSASFMDEYDDPVWEYFFQICTNPEAVLKKIIEYEDDLRPGWRENLDLTQWEEMIEETGDLTYSIYDIFEYIMRGALKKLFEQGEWEDAFKLFGELLAGDDYSLDVLDSFLVSARDYMKEGLSNSIPSSWPDSSAWAYHINKPAWGNSTDGRGIYEKFVFAFYLGMVRAVDSGRVKAKDAIEYLPTVNLRDSFSDFGLDTKQIDKWNGDIAQGVLEQEGYDQYEMYLQGMREGNK